MDRTLYQTICKNLNKSCSIEFSFSQHHKGLDFSKYFKNVSDKDSLFIADGIESWLYDILQEIYEKDDVYGNSGDCKFSVDKNVLVFNVVFYLNDDPEHYISEILTENLKQIIREKLKINSNELNNNLFNFHIDIDKNKGIEGFNKFEIYDVNNGKEIDLKEDLSLKVKEEILDIITKWPSPYFGDFKEFETNINCEQDDSFTITDMISFSKEIEISDE